MADLVIGDRALLGIRQDGVLLLVASDDDLDALLEIRLRHLAAARAHSAQRALVDDVGELCARGTGGHARDRVEVDIVCHADLFCMDLEDILAPLEVRQFDWHAAVKAARAQ